MAKFKWWNYRKSKINTGSSILSSEVLRDAVRTASEEGFRSSPFILSGIAADNLRIFSPVLLNTDGTLGINSVESHYSDVQTIHETTPLMEQQIISLRQEVDTLRASMEIFRIEQERMARLITGRY